jgi:hypothetical protein
MNAVVVAVVVVVIMVVIASVLLLRNISASPKRRYGRDLRSIRRIRGGNRAGDPNSTSIGVNTDAFHGS